MCRRCFSAFNIEMRLLVDGGMKLLACWELLSSTTKNSTEEIVCPAVVWLKFSSGVKRSVLIIGL